MSGSEDARGAIAFAEKVLELLDEGRYTATYKYAVLLALIDVCLESTKASGAPPEVLTTRQIAEKIVEMYWPHTVPFAGPAEPRVLRQNAGGQAEIVSAIVRFRSSHAPDPSAPRWQSQLAAPAAYGRLVNTVEWKLIEMPLPRLQMMGQALDSFIYDIHWDSRIQRRDVDQYLKGHAGFRRELGLSQADIAARMGTSQPAVARLESGTADVRLATLERHAAAVGRQLDWRLRGR